MTDRFSFELRSHPDGGKGFVVSVHRYQGKGYASTVDELEFDTFKDAVDYLAEELNA
jgi:hypothetical protein